MITREVEDYGKEASVKKIKHIREDPAKCQLLWLNETMIIDPASTESKNQVIHSFAYQFLTIGLA